MSFWHRSFSALYAERRFRAVFPVWAAIAILLIFAASACTSDSAQGDADAGGEPEFVPIFNGRDLSGWRLDRVEADRDLTLFTVEDGELVLSTPGTEEFAWLTYERELTDFILRLKFMAFRDSVGNCGIQFRDNWPDDQWYGRHGFDLASNVPQSTGFIWDFQEHWLPYEMEGYRAENFEPYLPEGWEYRWSTDEDPWNEFEVSVIGSEVRTVLNGKEIINWDGGELIQPEGHIAIEVHNGQVFKFRFKDIELADLSI